MTVENNCLQQHSLTLWDPQTFHYYRPRPPTSAWFEFPSDRYHSFRRKADHGQVHLVYFLAYGRQNEKKSIIVSCGAQSQSRPLAHSAWQCWVLLSAGLDPVCLVQWWVTTYQIHVSVLVAPVCWECDYRSWHFLTCTSTQQVVRVIWQKVGLLE